MGLVFGINNAITTNQNVSHNDSTSSLVYNTVTNYSGGTSTGFNFKLGASFKQNNRLYIFAEFSFISQFYSPSHSEITNYSLNGTDMLSTLSISERQTNYVAKSSGSSGGANDPMQSTAISYPFSSIGINFGIEYKFIQ